MKTERAIVFREVWRHNFTVQKLINLVHEYKNTDIVIDCAKESTLHHGNDPGVNIPWEKIIDAKFKNNNTVHLITGNFSTYSTEWNYPNDIEINRPGILAKAPVPFFEQAVKYGLIDQVHCWPTYFLVWNGFKIFRTFNRAHVDPLKEKLFFCAVRQAKPHRMLLLDELEKRKLLDREISGFTCLDPNKVWKENLDVVGGTNYYQGEVELSPLASENSDLYSTPPNIMKKCLINVVSETSLDSRFWTEKTAWPIIYQMPFLIHGARHTNNRLKAYGFKLFDELIDYSFDSIVSPRERTVAIAEELKRLADLNLNYEEVFESLRPIAEHNLWRLIELYHNDEYMPGFVRHASDRLVRATFDPTKPADSTQINPIIGNWLAYTENNGRNQKAVDVFRDNPYLHNLFKDRL